LATFVRVTGSVSGERAGVTSVASDGHTIHFLPRAEFQRGEIVYVSLTPRAEPSGPDGVQPLQYRFFVERRDAAPPAPAPPEDVDAASGARLSTAMATEGAEAENPQTAMIMGNGVSVPSDFPHVSITTCIAPSPGYIFLNHRESPYYSLILNNDGDPVWYQRTQDDRHDLCVQDNGLLTMLVRKGYPFGEGYIGLDPNYTQVRTFHATNGYVTDEHELQVLTDGGYLLLGLSQSLPVDMRHYVVGGSALARVRETVIQEYTARNELIFQWRAWDNFDIRDMVLVDLKDVYFEFPHMNAIDIDEDGHILLSSRQTSEVTKIHRRTGKILWRLGGAHNQFTFVNDPLGGFSGQHDFRALGHHRYTLFDNGNTHDPPVSRAVEYELDVNACTATLVWEFHDQPDRYSYSMGNVQRLPNGNTLINWAQREHPKLTEVDPNGRKVFEMDFVRPTPCYRVWRSPWEGMAQTPYLVVEPYADHLVLLFNKFGDRQVTAYRIYGGTSPQPTTLLLETPSTLARLTDLQNQTQYYFRVTGVNAQGAESAYSNEENLFVNFVGQPGAELIRNGDFFQGQEAWTLDLNSAAAQWSIVNGTALIAITSGGTQFDAVQLHQAGISLSQGRQYTLAFDLWGTAARVVEIEVKQSRSPYTSYSRIGYTAVPTEKKHYSFDFTMDSPTDTDAQIVINAGLSSVGIYLDNVSLKQK
jgi:hypothetical protein